MRLTSRHVSDQALEQSQSIDPPSAVRATPDPLGPVPQPAPLFSRRTIVVTDGHSKRKRHFLIHLPRRPSGQKTPMPAVIAFHGAAQKAAEMAVHWESVIARYDIVLVCPQALVDPATQRTSWHHAGQGDTSVPTTDLAFVDALLDWMASNGHVDMDRVYASGFSNGAGITWQLAMLDQFVNRFKGFAPVSSHGTQRAKLRLGDPIALGTPKPLIYTHGTADDNWSVVVNEEQQLLPPDVVACWVERNHAAATGAPTVYSCPSAEAVSINPTALEQLYLPKPVVLSSKAVCFITIVNGAHCWPLTGTDGSGRGLVCRDIDLSKRIIGFWNVYAGMGLPTTPYWRQC